MRSQIETGMPYIAFKDTLNRYNPNKHDGVIVGTNLCTESHSNVRPSHIGEDVLENGRVVRTAEGGLVHVCNLVSINLANIESDAELESVCETSVRLLDNAIDFTRVPVLEGQEHNKRYRTIGVGAMGLADMLAKNNIPYILSADYVDELFEKSRCITSALPLNWPKKRERSALMKVRTGAGASSWGTTRYGSIKMPNIPKLGTNSLPICRNTAFATAR